MRQVQHICENLDDFCTFAAMIFYRHTNEKGRQTCDEKEVHVCRRARARPFVFPLLLNNVFLLEFARHAILSRQKSGQIDGQSTECSSHISTRDQTCARVHERSPSSPDGTSNISDHIGKQASDSIARSLHAPSSDDHHS